MKAKIVTASALFLAGLGAIASVNQGPQRSEPAPAETLEVRSEGQPVETPLVAKLLPKSPQVAETHQKSPQLPVDGQLSPGGQWRWNEAQWAWVPVKQAGPAWVQDGHSATIDHLVNEHGYKRASLVNLTQQQLDVLHSNAHNAARAAAPVRSSCPSGNCPNTNVRVGIFGRRR